MLQQLLFQAASINTNPHGTTVGTGGVHHLAHPGRRADISRINAQTGCAIVRSLQGPFVVEMNICNDRDAGLIDNFL